MTYANGGHALKIEVNKGVSATLIAGPDDLDALGRLGIDAGTISNDARPRPSSSSSKQVYGLGFSGLKPVDRRPRPMPARRAPNC